jgi:hypothetical protein
MKVKRLLGSLAVAGTLTALSIGTAVPAFADPHIKFTFSPSDGAPLPASLDPHGIRLAVSVKTDCVLLCSTTLSFTVKDPDGKTVASVSPSSNTGNFATASTAWDTKPTSTKNGNYTFAASAAEDGPLSPPSENPQVTLKLNNPPVAPTGVQTALDPSGIPVVSWSANPEPDIKGYQVFRSDQGLQSGLITTTSFRDTTAPKGQDVSYKVSALRYSPVDPSGMTGSGTSNQTASVSVPAPADPGAPGNVATADPAKGGAPAGPMKQPVNLGVTKPSTPITAPTLPTRVVQLPQPNVVQFAPLLPYSGKIPEVPTTSNVPAPVAAQADSGSGGGGQATVVGLPGGVKVTPVDAVKYVATAAFLLVAAIHITRFARKLRNSPV